MEISREDITETLSSLELDWGDEDDAQALIEIILERFELLDAYTWLFFPHPGMEGSPLTMLRMGRSREVFKAARGLVANGRE